MRSFYTCGPTHGRLSCLCRCYANNLLCSNRWSQYCFDVRWACRLSESDSLFFYYGFPSVIAPDFSTLHFQRPLVHSQYLQYMATIQGGPKSKPAYVCNNFVYCQPIFIIFGTLYTIGNLQPEDIVSPPNMVCVTTLPCKTLTTTFSTLNVIQCCKKVQFANFCRMIFKRIVPDEYYLFSSDGYNTRHLGLCRNKSYNHGQHFSNVP